MTTTIQHVTITNTEYQELKQKELKLTLIQQLIEINPEKYSELISVINDHAKIIWLKT